MIGSWLEKAMLTGWLGVASLVLVGQSQAFPSPAEAYPDGMPGGQFVAEEPPSAEAAPGEAQPAAPGPTQPHLPGYPVPYGAAHPGWGSPPPPPPPPEPECSPCDEIGARCYFNVEYLFWGFRSRDLPALVTSGDLQDAIPGAIGQPTTDLLISGTSGEDDERSGVRLNLGFTLDHYGIWVLDGSFFVFAEQDARQLATGTGSPGTRVIARPFFNAVSLVESADPVVVPGVLSGTITVETPRQLFGGDVNLIRYFSYDFLGQSRTGFIVGARYAHLDQKLLITESLQDLPGLGAPPNTYALREDFTTFNRFYGAQLGLVRETVFGRINLQLLAKVAFGINDQTLVTRGFTQITAGDGTIASSTNRGLLIQPSNTGRFSKTIFSILPEVTGNVAYSFNDHIRVGVGYTLLYWTEVLNPEDAVDRTVALQAIQPIGQVGPNRPSVDLSKDKNFWAQGLNVSLQITY